MIDHGNKPGNEPGRGDERSQSLDTSSNPLDTGMSSSTSSNLARIAVVENAIASSRSGGKGFDVNQFSAVRQALGNSVGDFGVDLQQVNLSKSAVEMRSAGLLQIDVLKGGNIFRNGVAEGLINEGLIDTMMKKDPTHLVFKLTAKGVEAAQFAIENEFAPVSDLMKKMRLTQHEASSEMIANSNSERIEEVMNRPGSITEKTKEIQRIQEGFEFKRGQNESSFKATEELLDAADERNRQSQELQQVKEKLNQSFHSDIPL